MAEKARKKGAEMIVTGLWVRVTDTRVCRSICYGAHDIRRVLVIRLSDRRIARLAVAATLVTALGLAGCGRKGGLDAPPSSMPASPQPQANMQPPLGEQAPIFGGPAFGSPAPEPSPQQQAQAAPPVKKSFFLDWLLN
jgi:predicted small lipoprotein YifL